MTQQQEEEKQEQERDVRGTWRRMKGRKKGDSAVREEWKERTRTMRISEDEEEQKEGKADT